MQCKVPYVRIYYVIRIYFRINSKIDKISILKNTINQLYSSTRRKRMVSEFGNFSIITINCVSESRGFFNEDEFMTRFKMRIVMKVSN